MVLDFAMGSVLLSLKESLRSKHHPHFGWSDCKRSKDKYLHFPLYDSVEYHGWSLIILTKERPLPI